MAALRATRQRASLLSDTAIAALKNDVGAAAAELVREGMQVGLGTGTTVACLLPALAQRRLAAVRYAATSPQTEQAALALGLDVRPLDALGELDMAIDGADQVSDDGWVIKGGGGAHTREKIVAAAARRFVVIVSADKLVRRVSPPVPLELVRFGADHTLAAVGHAELRGETMSPDGGLIADYRGPVGEPRRLAERLSATPGVVEHGLFAPELVSLILVAHPSGVERRAGAKRGR